MNLPNDLRIEGSVQDMIDMNRFADIYKISGYVEPSFNVLTWSSLDGPY